MRTDDPAWTCTLCYEYHFHRAEAARRRYLTDYYTDEAVKAITVNANRPFFLYLAHWGAHAIYSATATIITTCKRAT